MSDAAFRKPSRSVAQQQLIAAAERLFAESGIDAVSLRQINVAAKQKNSSAAHYHFGSKEALILAIYGARMESVNIRRESALAGLEAGNQQQDIRALVETIVQPIVDEIDADDSGSAYIGFMAQAIGHPQLDLAALWQQEHSDGLVRVLKLLQAALPHLQEPLFGQRFGLAFEQIIHSLADREKLRGSDTGFKVHSDLFLSNLIDSIAGSMTAAISDQTLEQLKLIKI
jgi:AcrR family transcriptional regulator